jgi:hypothetical protein
MASKPPCATESLADCLRPLLRLGKARLTLGELVERVERADGPGPVLLILTLPVLMPLPPGVSMVFALPLLLVAPQLIVARRHIWLPKFLRKREIKRRDLVKVLRRVLPMIERVEKVVHPRLGFLTGPTGAAVVGMACTLLALVLVLPIPFANLAPAIAMGAFAIGLTRKDGVFVLAGYGLIAIAAAVVYAGVHGATLGLGHLKGLL